MSENNAIATRRSKYMEGIAEAYVNSYGLWLEKQSAEKQSRIRNKSNYIKHGLITIAPINCLGPIKCPFFHACPIPESVDKPGPSSEYPINMPCVLEVEYIAQQALDYMEHLKVDPKDPVEMSLINELALLDLWKNRAILILAGGDIKGQGRDMLAIDENIVFDPNGNPHTNYSIKPHPAIDVLDRHEKRRARILDKFAATRESKIKVYGGNIESNNKLQQDVSILRAYVENLTKVGALIDASEEESTGEVLSLIGEVDGSL